MIFSVYTRSDGACLLVPECMTAPHAAESRYGPLKYRARIDSGDFPVPAIWDRVSAEIDDHFYAVLQAAVGHHLLGIDCTGGPATSWDKTDPAPAAY